MKNEKIIEEIKTLLKEAKNIGVEFDIDYENEIEEWKNDYEALKEIRDEVYESIVKHIFKTIVEKYIFNTYYDTTDDSGIGIYDRGEDFLVDYCINKKKLIVYTTLMYGIKNPREKLAEKYNELLSQLSKLKLKTLSLKSDRMIVHTQWDIQPRQYTEIVFKHNKDNQTNINEFKNDIEKIVKTLIEWVSDIE